MAGRKKLNAPLEKWCGIVNRLRTLAKQHRLDIPPSFRYLLQDHPDIDLTQLISHVELSIWRSALTRPADDFELNVILLIFAEYVSDLGVWLCDGRVTGSCK